MLKLRESGQQFQKTKNNLFGARIITSGGDAWFSVCLLLLIELRNRDITKFV